MVRNKLHLFSPSFEFLVYLRSLDEPQELRFDSDKRMVIYLANNLETVVPSFRRFLSLRLHSRREVKNYLKKKFRPGLIKGEEEAFFQLLLDYLVEEKITNSEEEFVAFWVRSRLHNTPRSLYGLKYELSQKGVNPKIVDKVIEELMAAGEYDELTALERLYQRYRRKGKEKFYQAARRHRFSWETIKKLDQKLSSL